MIKHIALEVDTRRIEKKWNRRVNENSQSQFPFQEEAENEKTVRFAIKLSFAVASVCLLTTSGAWLQPTADLPGDRRRSVVL